MLSSRVRLALVILTWWLTHPSALAGSQSRGPNTLACGLGHCSAALLSCSMQPSCRATLGCNRRCSEEADGGPGEQACHLLCQVEEGRDSRAYRRVVQCFADHQCLPRAEAGRDGICPVTEENSERIVPVAELSDLHGTWHELRGRNCGRPDSDWQGGYDQLPCRSSSWVAREDETWYHTSFAGTAGEGGPLPYLIAEPEVTAEGALEVHYTNPPLTPQIERWYVLSQPHPDWITYTYCGETPAGSYAGVNVINRAGVLTGEQVPEDIAEAFRADLALFGLDWDAFCSIDHRSCTPPQPEADLQEHQRLEAE